MTTTQQQTAPEEKGVQVTIRIEIATTIKGEQTLTKVMDRAKAVTEEAKKYGIVRAELLLGRQKLAIT